MSKHSKLVDKLLRKPGSCSYLQVRAILVSVGFEVIQPKRGSHVKFKHYLLASDLIIPVHNNECKDFYKKEAKKRVEEILSKQ